MKTQHKNLDTEVSSLPGAMASDQDAIGELSTREHAPALKAIVLPALLLFVALTLLTGLVYPLVVTAVATTFYPNEAEGSLIHQRVANKDVIVGSKLLGQNFSAKKYFWGRPSATTPAYNAAASSGSNLGPTNKSYLSTVQERSSQIRNTLKDKAAAIPVDLVTASGSGLDPDISPAAAALQIDRVALERGLPRAQVQTLLAAYTKQRQMGIFGEPRVNVVELNLALDNLMP